MDMGRLATDHGHGAGRSLQWLEGVEGEDFVDMMEEDAELEDGETMEGNSLVEDLDSRFGYLDTKIEAVLGHCQKDFQGSLYPDKLGSKFGGYGSFLPTSVRGAPVLRGPSQAPASVPPPSRVTGGQRGRGMTGSALGAASEMVTQLSHDPRVGMQINGINHPLDECGSEAVEGNAADESDPLNQKKGLAMTVRISLQRQGVDTTKKKAMYNGFGLDHSSSPSVDEEGEDIYSATDDERSPERSPSDIIRIMTSHQLPLGGLLSPLADFISEQLEQRERHSSKLKIGPVSMSGPYLGPMTTKFNGSVGTDGTVTKREKAFEKLKRKASPEDIAVKETPIGRGLKEITKVKTDRDAQKQLTKDSGKRVDAVAVAKEVITDLFEGKKGRESSKRSQAQKDVKARGNEVPKAHSKGTKEEILTKEVMLRDDAFIDGELSKQSSGNIPRDSMRNVGKRDILSQDTKAGKKGGRRIGREPKSVISGGDMRDGAAGAHPSVIEYSTGGQPAGSQPVLLPVVGGSGHETAAGAILPAGQLVLDHWVQCDKCQQWRLLLPSIDPAVLPEKWLCKRMTWLPGMNNCKFSEDATTAAVYNCLGLQNPALSQANAAPQALQSPVVPAPALPSELGFDSGGLGPKAAKVQRSASKKALDKKGAVGIAKAPAASFKKLEMGSVKSKSLNDVVKRTADHVLLEKRKSSEKEHVRLLQAKEGDRVHLERHLGNSRVSGSGQDFNSGQSGIPVKLPVTADRSSADQAGQGRTCPDSIDPENGKRQRGYLLQDSSKSDSDSFRGTKGGAPQEDDDLRFTKKRMTQDIRIFGGSEAVARCKAFDDGDAVSPQNVGDGLTLQGDEFCNHDSFNSKNAARSASSGDPLKLGKATSLAVRDIRNGATRKDLLDGRTLKTDQKPGDTQFKQERVDKQDSGDIEKDNYHTEDLGKALSSKEGRHKFAGNLRPSSPISCKAPCSSESSAFGTKGESPVESTVSSSPLRSSKVIEQGISEGLKENQKMSCHLSTKLNSGSPGLKRPLDQNKDSNGNRADGNHSSDREHQVRGSAWDTAKENSNGIARKNNPAKRVCREDADSCKHDKGHAHRSHEGYQEAPQELTLESEFSFAEEYYKHHDDHYQEKEDSIGRYRNRDDRYERRKSHEDCVRLRMPNKDTESEWERDAARGSCAADKSGNPRECLKERQVLQEHGGKSSSLENLPDRHGCLNWRNPTRLATDMKCGGRTEDETTEIKQESSSNHVVGSEDGLLDDTEVEAAPVVQKDDVGKRSAKTPFAASKDSEAQPTTTRLNTGGRVEGLQTYPRMIAVYGRTGQMDGAAHDNRIVEDGKQITELKNHGDEDAVPVNVAKGIGSSGGHNTKCFDKTYLSPVKKEHLALSQRLTKDGQDLKHSADRLKNSTSMECLSTNIYMQAALNFLESAHHLEMASLESIRLGDTSQSILMYNDTAKLCDFCATTYERQRDLAAAALAHICAAVARFRALMSTAASLNRDCMELQNAANSATALAASTSTAQHLGFARVYEKSTSSHGLSGPPVVGESPSSSSSDVDNLNTYAAAADKSLAAPLVKGPSTSLIPDFENGSNIIPNRLFANFQRTIRSGMDVFIMMESWMKAQSATAAAENACIGSMGEGMVAIRRVGEIGLLGNMDAVVRQARLALEAIGH